MNTNPDQPETRADSQVVTNDRIARWVVWTLWSGMVALFLWCYLLLSSPVPLAEDWHMVAALTGHEPDLPRWLWAQNNEHRTPIARFVQLALLRVSGGDFRSGGIFNLVILAATAAGLMLHVRHQRGGRTEIADAFFPLLLLHFGHSVHILFPWQISFVLPTVLVVILGSALFRIHDASAGKTGAMWAVLLPLLPLNGLNGLLFAPVMLVCAAWTAWICRGQGTRGRRLSRQLLVSAALTGLLSMLYFVGYAEPGWNPPSPGNRESAAAALKVLAMGFGPSVKSWWHPFVLVALGVVVASGWSWFTVARQHQGTARQYWIMAGLYLAAAWAFAGAIGWARAGYVPVSGLPTRYSLVVVPALCATFLVSAHASIGLRRGTQRVLALLLALLLPFNTLAGFRQFGDWYRDGMAALQADIDAGKPLRDLAVRHREFLIHWWDADELERHMRWLRNAHVPPFDRAVDAAAVQE